MVAQNKVNSCLTGFLVCVNVIFMLFGLGLMTAGIYLLASQWKDIEPTLMVRVMPGATPATPPPSRCVASVS